MIENTSRERAILKVLSKPKMPFEIHREALKGVVSLSNTTEVFKALLRKGIIFCLNGHNTQKVLLVKIVNIRYY